MTRRSKRAARLAMLADPMLDPQISHPAPYPRGVFPYVTPREWRLLAGAEFSRHAHKHPREGSYFRLDLYLGLGPLMLRVTL